MNTEKGKQQRAQWKQWGASLAGIALVIGLSWVLYTQRAAILRLQGYGYLGLFLFSLLSNASVVIPLPGTILPYVMGAVLNPWGVALAAGSGAALGELTGYFTGWSGTIALQDSQRYQRVRVWMERYGVLTVFVLAYLPLPLMDLAGIAAGASRMPLHRFLFWCGLGKILKMLTVAYLGAFLL